MSELKVWDFEGFKAAKGARDILLNGAQMKRESWPAHLRTLLDYKSIDW